MFAREHLGALALCDVAYCLPDKVVDAHTWAARCGQPSGRATALTRNEARCFHDAAGESPAELAIKAVRALLAAGHATPDSIDALIYAHTIQSSVLAPPASTAHQIQSKAGLMNALAFSVTQQNCVSPFAAIRAVRALMAHNASIMRAIVVCADLIAPGCDHLRAIQDLALHSDGACALLLERDGIRNRIESLYLHTDGRFFRRMSGDDQSVPDDRYYWSAFTTMRAALRQARVQPDQITCVLPHHVNLPGWQRLMTMLDIAQDRLFTRNFARIGHVFGADPFINFQDCESRPPGGRSLLFSSGLVGCFGAMVVRH
jgi:3-oxoacyl-[acyl-carrier-protein] synthase-3